MFTAEGRPIYRNSRFATALLRVTLRTRIQETARLELNCVGDCSKSQVSDSSVWVPILSPRGAVSPKKNRGASMQGIRNRGVWAAACVILLFLCASALRAQVNTATVSGTVVDPQGLAVHGAKVTVTSPVTDAVREAITDGSGRYNLVGLPPGKYVLQVEDGANFAAYEDAALILTVGANATYDPHLSLTGVRQTVTVSSEATNVETSKTEVSQTIEQRRIDNLPINGRNYINFTLTNCGSTHRGVRRPAIPVCAAHDLVNHDSRKGPSFRSALFFGKDRRTSFFRSMMERVFCSGRLLRRAL